MLDPRAVGVHGRILVVAAVLSAAGCNDFYTCNTDGALPPPDLAEGNCLLSDPDAPTADSDDCYARRLLIQSMPLQLGANDTVRVDARVVGVRFTYGADSLYVVPEDSDPPAPTLEWSAFGGLDTSQLAGTTSALLLRRSGKLIPPASGADSLVATPKHLGIRRKGYRQDRLRVVDPGSAGTPVFVVVKAPFEQAGRSNIALVRAKGGTQCEETRLLSFARTGVLTEDLVHTCDSGGGKADTLDAALLPGSGIADRSVFPQKDLPDTVSFLPAVSDLDDAAEDHAQPESFAIRVITWLEPDNPAQEALVTKIGTWLAIADSVLATNRTGLRIHPDWKEHVAELDGPLPLGSKGGLGAVCDTLTASKYARPAEVDLTQGINLFLAGSIGDDNGLACPDSTNGVVILGAGAQALTFVHELGHTLGLRPWGAPPQTDPGYPWTGHTHKNPDILLNNVMWPKPNDGSAGHRNEFTLGQVYRMNFDVRSWIATAADPGGSPKATRTMVLCQNSATASWPCPRLDLDFADLLPPPVAGSSQ